MKRFTIIRKLSRAAYTVGVVFLLAGMVLSAVAQPALAEAPLPTEQPPAQTEETQVVITDVPTEIIDNSVLPTAAPTNPGEEQVVPTEEQPVPTEEQVVPTEEPAIPTEEPALPTEQPAVEPTETAVVPTEETVVPSETPVEPTATPEAPVVPVCTDGATPVLMCTDGAQPGEDGTCLDASTPALACPQASTEVAPSENPEQPAANCSINSVSVTVGACNPDGSYKVNIINNNGVTEWFRWKFDNNDYVNWTQIGGNSNNKTKTVDAPSAGAHTITVQIALKSGNNYNIQGERKWDLNKDCPLPPPDIQDGPSYGTPTCNETGDSIAFSVTNTNSFAVDFIYTLDTTPAQSGTLHLSGGETDSTITSGSGVYTLSGYFSITQGGQTNNNPSPKHPATVTSAACTPEPPTWSKSSLSFSNGGTATCQVVSAEVCNTGDGNMSGTSTWELYYSTSGNPKPSGSGSLVTSGTIPQLASKACFTIEYTSGIEQGNYMFRALQETGHPGQGDLWSNQLTVTQECNPDPPTTVNLLEPGLSPACNNDHELTWTVTNPNDVTVTFHYGNGATLEIAANSSNDGLVTDAGATLSGYFSAANTATVIYQDSTTASEAGPTCPVPPPALTSEPRLEKACDTTNGGTIWTIYNDNSFAVVFEYNLDGVPGSLEISGDNSITLNGPATEHILSGRFTVTHDDITKVGPEVSATSDLCPVPPADIANGPQLEKVCNLIEGGTTWTISNGNGFQVTFEYALDGVPGSLTLGANASNTLDGPVGVHTLSGRFSVTNGIDTNYYPPTNEPAASMTSDACPAPSEPIAPSIQTGCSYRGEDGPQVGGARITWTVTNNNLFGVTFHPTWSPANPLDGSPIDIAASSSVTLLSPNGIYTLSGYFTATVNDHNIQVPVEGEVSTTSQLCFVPRPLTVGNDPTCDATGTGIIWTATNTNDRAGTVVWTLDGLLTNEIPAAAGETVHIITTPLGNHNMELYFTTGESRTETIIIPANIETCSTTPDKPVTNKPGKKVAAETVSLPVPVGRPQALIPVTGADLDAPVARTFGFGLLQQMMFNFGLVFLGMAFVLDGASRKMKKTGE